MSRFEYQPILLQALVIFSSNSMAFFTFPLIERFIIVDFWCCRVTDFQPEIRCNEIWIDSSLASLWLGQFAVFTRGCLTASWWVPKRLIHLRVANQWVVGKAICASPLRSGQFIPDSTNESMSRPLYEPRWTRCFWCTFFVRRQCSTVVVTTHKSRCRKYAQAADVSNFILQQFGHQRKWSRIYQSYQRACAFNYYKSPSWKVRHKVASVRNISQALGAFERWEQP